MGLPCSKLNKSNLIKDRNIIFAVSKRYINIFKVVRNPCQKITLLLLESKSVGVIVPESCF